MSADRSHRRVPNAVKAQILERAGNACEFCRYHQGTLSYHHLLPVSAGGTSEPDNVVVVCERCHGILHYNHTLLTRIGIERSHRKSVDMSSHVDMFKRITESAYDILDAIDDIPEAWQ